MNDAPVAQAKSYGAQANMKITGLGGLLSGVTDADTGVNGCSPSFTVASVGPTTSPAGGIISNVNASTGTFDFDPPPGVTGNVTFSYTVQDNGCPDTATSAPATITVNVAGPVVWFVNSAAASNGSGTLSSPFNVLAAADAVDAASQGVFLYSSATNYTGALALNSGERLIGQPTTGTTFDSIFGVSPPTGTIARPTLGSGTVTMTGTVTLANSTTLRGLALSTGASTGLTDPASALTSVDVDQASVATTTGTGLALSDIGGTVKLAALTSNGGTGANLTGSNSGATFDFTGVAISSGANPGLAATGGGTIRVTGTTNTIASTTGTALNVSNTTIGAGGLTFQSISANGAENGILLSNTGATAGLTVTGDGGTCTNADPSGCSGGVIQNAAGADDSTATPVGTGIVLNSTAGVSLTRMHIHDHSNYGIRATGVSNFTLANSVINGTNGGATAASAGSPFNDSSVYFTNLTGSASVSNTHISGGFSNNVKLVNSAGTLDRLTFSSVTIGANSTAEGNDGIGIEGQGASTVKVTVQNSTFTSARGDLFAMAHVGSGTADLVFSGNALSNNHPAIATGGGGVTLVNGSTSAFTMSLTNSTFRDAVGHAVLIVKDVGTGSQSVTFSGNTIGVAGVVNSGSLEGSDLKIQQAGGGTQTVRVSNNLFHQYNNDAVLLQTGAGAAAGGTLNATVTGNTVSNAGNNPLVALPVQGINLNGGVTPGDTFTICAQIGGAAALQNNLAGAAGPFGGGDYRLRQRQSTTVQLPGYAGGATNTAAVVAFVNANNIVSGSGTATVNSPPGGGFVGVASCPVP